MGVLALTLILKSEPTVGHTVCCAISVVQLFTIHYSLFTILGTDSHGLRLPRNYPTLTLSLRPFFWGGGGGCGLQTFGVCPESVGIALFQSLDLISALAVPVRVSSECI